MLTGMRITNPKFVKSDIKPKKTKHCTIPKKKNFDERRTKKSSKKGTRLINMKVAIKETTEVKTMHKSQVWGS